MMVVGLVRIPCNFRVKVHMNNLSIKPTTIENSFSDDEIIVSKTNLKGEITYVNDIFCKVAEMDEGEVLGKPHNIIRHPDMPRSVFKLLWERIKDKKEIFAYVKNIAKSGNFYWVFAHVTPTLNEAGEIIGYHSSRRQAPADEVEVVSDLYRNLLKIENNASNRKEGLEAAIQFLEKTLAEAGLSYDQYVWQVGK